MKYDPTFRSHVAGRIETYLSRHSDAVNDVMSRFGRSGVYACGETSLAALTDDGSESLRLDVIVRGGRRDADDLPDGVTAYFRDDLRVDWLKNRSFREEACLAVPLSTDGIVYDIRNGDVYGGLGLHDVAQNKFRYNNTSYDEGFLEHRAQKLMRRYGLQPHTTVERRLGRR